MPELAGQVPPTLTNVAIYGVVLTITLCLADTGLIIKHANSGTFTPLRQSLLHVYSMALNSQWVRLFNYAVATKLFANQSEAICTFTGGSGFFAWHEGTG